MFGAAPGAAAYRNRPPTVPGHQRDRPETSGRTHRDHWEARRAKTRATQISGGGEGVKGVQVTSKYMYWPWQEFREIHFDI